MEQIAMKGMVSRSMRMAIQPCNPKPLRPLMGGQAQAMGLLRDLGPTHMPALLPPLRLAHR